VSLAVALSAGLGLAAVGLAQPARAATTITVASCDETSLDAAVAQANSDSAGDIITFSCSGTIGLTSPLAITGSMTLDGAGQVTLSGQGQVSVLDVASGVTFTLANLTVTDGAHSGLLNNGGTVNITGSTFRGNVAGLGGGVDNFSGGTVNITGSTFQGNYANNGGGGAINNDLSTVNITGSLFAANFADLGGSKQGGAILNGGGTMSIIGSSFVDNTASFGAALYSEGTSGTMDVTNSSFYVNVATVTGGAIEVHGGTANITFSSFNGNETASGGGGNLEIDSGKAKVAGSILGNAAGGNCAGVPPVDQGYNMEAGTDCGFTGTGDLQNTDPVFAPGFGPGDSLILAQGSPGIDAVPLSVCPPTDQNGNPRPDDPSETACDMGATESAYAAAATTTSLSSSANPSRAGQAVTYTATVSPAPDGGTAGFTDNGSAITGCSAVSLSAGTATCPTTPQTTGAHNIVATFSGSNGFAGSTSSTVTQVVTKVPCPSLAGCNLAGLNLTDAHLAGTNLSNANLNGANLTGADLTKANLAGADLTKANLAGADLSGASLAGANLNKVTWSGTTCPDGTNSDADGGTCLGHL
jgi:hypothetical protein